MSFNKSAYSYYYDQPRNCLWAVLRDWEHNWKLSVLNLNGVLGNHNGNFNWGSRDFSQTGKFIDWDHDTTTLRFRLVNWDNKENIASVKLNDGIQNHNGVLCANEGFFAFLFESFKQVLEQAPSEVNEWLNQYKCLDKLSNLSS